MEVSVVLKDKIELWFVIEYDIIFILIGILNPYLFISQIFIVVLTIHFNTFCLL